MRLIRSEYERKYKQALLLVAERFKVGQPYRDENDNRVCLIGDILLAFDYDVFMLGWSKTVAEDLTSSSRRVAASVVA